MAEQTLTLNMTQAAYVTSFAPNTPGPLNTGDEVQISGTGRLAMRFEDMPAALKYKRLVKIGVVNVHMVDNAYMRLAAIASFNKNTLTWNTLQAIGSSHDVSGFFQGIKLYSTDQEQDTAAKEFLQYSCLYLQPRQETSRDDAILERFVEIQRVPYKVIYATPPQIEVIYDDGPDVSSKIWPTGVYSGHIDQDKPFKYSWDFVPVDFSTVCAGDFEQASATFYWKVSGGNYTAIQPSDNNKYVVIPAGTFPQGENISYYIEGTDTNGTTSTYYGSFNTIDATATASAISPINTVEDGSAPITFRWSLANAYGNDPSLVELLWKMATEDEQSWRTILSTAEPLTEFTAAGGTFQAGEIQWKVRAYNLDNVMGPESETSFICVAAPAAPDGITADSVPFATIQWQCEGQQAYQILIDGVDYGVKFGTDKIFRVEDPLEDGQHTVEIRAQGVYGLWSQPGTLIFTTTNTPGDSVTLYGDAGADANLFWTTEAASQDFYIYRDGVKIGHTDRTSFSDRLSLGLHSYYVLNRLPNGNYTRSNDVTLTISTDSVLVAEFPPQVWLKIDLSENSDFQQGFQYRKTMSLRHVYGAAYPVLENSSFEDASGSFDTAFLEPETAQAFETLKGKLICIKGRKGTIFVGAMATMNKTVRSFYTSYTFTLNRVHWEDFIDDANG